MCAGNLRLIFLFIFSGLMIFSEAKASNISQFFSSSGGGSAMTTYADYSTAGTFDWVAPPGVTEVRYLIYGAGGGQGGSVSNRNPCNGTTPASATSGSAGSSSSAFGVTATGGEGGTKATMAASGSGGSGGVGTYPVYVQMFGINLTGVGTGAGSSPLHPGSSGSPGGAPSLVGCSEDGYYYSLYRGGGGGAGGFMQGKTTVIPGNTYQIVVGSGGNGGNGGYSNGAKGNNGRVIIIW